jgi:hypothetical protein
VRGSADIDHDSCPANVHALPAAVFHNDEQHCRADDYHDDRLRDGRM